MSKMTDRMNWIDALPIDAREEILHDLSKNYSSDLVPLTINDSVYWIPMEVNTLIEALERGSVGELNEERISS